MKLETPCPICNDAAGESAVVEIVRHGILLYHCNGCGSEIQPQWWAKGDGKTRLAKVIAARLKATEEKEGAGCEGCVESAVAFILKLDLALTESQKQLKQARDALVEIATAQPCTVYQRDAVMRVDKFTAYLPRGTVDIARAALSPATPKEP